jgi:hypothetical protein
VREEAWRERYRSGYAVCIPFSVLSRCIWAREAEGNAIILEELVESKIIKLSAIVSPKGEN